MAKTDASGSAGAGALRDNFADFFKRETSGALVLLVATVVALIVANSALWPAYEHFWEIEAGFFAGQLQFYQSLLHWVDDALMALFFFVIGLEIKREVLVGELSTARGAALPAFAAAGGMVVPALIYVAFNVGGPDIGGWGVPMATDIAFALGVIALLGSRVPAGLKVFLAALAIVDDIGAILVIALFYSSGIEVGWLAIALVPLGALVLMNRRHVQEPIAYLAVGSLLWFAVLNSGIHATIAGVIVAFTVPSRARLAPLEFTNLCRIKIDDIEAIDVPGAHTLEDHRQQEYAFDIQRAALAAAAPLQRLEFALLPFTTYVVLPLFALANAGIRLVGSEGSFLTPPVIGIFLGLVVGKPLGVTLAAVLAVRTGIASRPSGVYGPHILGAGMLAGIGFTMSLFVANLAFESSAVASEAKAAILAASVVAGTLGYLFLRYFALASSATGSVGSVEPSSSSDAS